MSKKTLPNELVRVMAENTIEKLREIDCLYVSHFASDTSGAIREGAVLLSIAVDDSKDKGDGFKYLIGLPRHVKITPYLGNYFSR
jgi:hypothetical protein